MKRNPNWKLYPITARSSGALARLSESTGKEQTTEYLRRANNKRMREARARITEALKILIEERQLITISELSRRSGSCRATVLRHADIWGGHWGTIAGRAYHSLSDYRDGHMQLYSDVLESGR
jgi:hypothetical protein